MKFPTGKKLLRVVAAGMIASSSLLSLAFGSAASADSLGNLMVRFDNMKINGTTTGTVCAKPSATNLASAEASVTVTFPTGFTVSTTASNWVVSVANTSSWPTAGTVAPWPGITAPTSGQISGLSVTFASGDLTSSTTLYCFNWTTAAALTEPGAASANEAGTVATQTSVPAAIDSSPFSTATLTDNTVTVTATVPPLFSFALSSNNDPLGTVTTAHPFTSASAITATVSTNAKAGWFIWGKDGSSQGLHSTQASATIAADTSGSNVTLNGTQGADYVTGLTSGSSVAGSTATIVPKFVGSTQYEGGGLSSALQTLATATGPSDTATVSIKNSVEITNVTPAATDYSDVQTYSAAAQF